MPGDAAQPAAAERVEVGAMYCRACKYPLAQLTSQRCPECGRPFNPGNPNSYLSRPFGAFTRAMVQPPGRLLHVVMLLLCGLTVVITVRPFVTIAHVGILIELALLVLLYWAAKFAAAIVCIGWQNLRREERRIWLRAPKIAIVSAALLITGAPRNVLFWLAWPRLAAVAASVRAGEPAPERFWAGPVYVTRRDGFAGWVRFHTVLDFGWLVADEDLPPYRYGLDIRSAGGHWYAWQFERDNGCRPPPSPLGWVLLGGR